MIRKIAAVAVDMAATEGWIAAEALTYKDEQPYASWAAIVRANPSAKNRIEIVDPENIETLYIAIPLSTRLDEGWAKMTDEERAAEIGRYQRGEPFWYIPDSVKEELLKPYEIPTIEIDRLVQLGLDLEPPDSPLDEGWWEWKVRKDILQEIEIMKTEDDTVDIVNRAIHKIEMSILRCKENGQTH